MGISWACVRETGVALGIWESSGNGIALMVPVRGTSWRISAIERPFRTFEFLGRKPRTKWERGADDRQIVGIGAGALGSQIILNSARAGFGRWAIIDRDCLLRTTSRDTRSASWNWASEAVVLAAIANRLTDDPDAFEPIVADILTSGPERAPLDERLQNAGLIAVSQRRSQYPVTWHTRRQGLRSACPSS